MIRREGDNILVVICEEMSPEKAETVAQELHDLATHIVALNRLQHEIEIRKKKHD